MARRTLEHGRAARPDRGRQDHGLTRSKIYPDVHGSADDRRTSSSPCHIISACARFSIMRTCCKPAGVAAPPKTWDELIADCQVIKAKTGKFGFGIAGTGVRSPQELIMYLAQNDLSTRRAPGGRQVQEHLGRRQGQARKARRSVRLLQAACNEAARSIRMRRAGAGRRKTRTSPLANMQW